MNRRRDADTDRESTDRPRKGAARGGAGGRGGATFTEGPVLGHILRLAAFMALGSVSMNVARLAEAIYLGVIGTEALAALGFAFPITMTLFAFAGGIGTGASSVIARTVGSGDRRAVARLVTHCQLLVLLVGVAVGVVGTLFAEDVITALGARDEVRAMAIEYMHVYLIGFPLFMLSMVGSTLLRATGSAASPGIVMTAGSILQIAFGPFLIYGWAGFPELGIAGAAWAYVASRVVSIFLYGALLVRAHMTFWSLDQLFASWRAIFHVGLPATASGLIQPVSMLIVTRLLATHGHEVVAGFNVASRVETLVHMIIMAVSSSVGPFVGQNWGARQYERVNEALSLCNRIALVWGVVTFLFLAVAGRYLVALIDDNPTVVEVARMFFWIIPLSIGFMGMMMVASSCFNALGKPMPPLVIATLRTFVVYIPLAIFGSWLWGYVGIFLATAFTNVLLGVTAWQWNRAVVKRERQLAVKYDV
ncbi:MAG: MATE family efflux transporter [Gammaproteobacteria bacterium]|nr:MATE family efflux transporter [Gammaproteobacteria bacterium]